MGGIENRFFSARKRKDGLCVLTITATFPSLIQPWLVNQLVQIVENGGENRILARQSEEHVYNSNIDKYNLVSCSRLIPDSKRGLLMSLFSALSRLEGLISFFRGVSRYPAILFSSRFTFKEKLLSLFQLPYMGLTDIDVIHSHSEMAGNRFMPIIVALDKPFVITFHGLPPVGVNPISREQRRRYVEQAAIILVNTEFARKQYASLGGDESKIRILPQGIELHKFPFRVRPFPDNGVINILTVGRFHPDKGQRYAIAAVADLIKAGYRVRYRLVGNGPEQVPLQELAESLGIAEALEFHSLVTDEDLQRIYDDSHIFVLPSLKDKQGLHEETQGVVLQEAQASGLITIATRVGGIPECIDDGISGFLVKDRSSDEIKQKIIDLIEASDQWEQIQVRGRQWVEGRYSIEVIGKKINALYNEITE